MSKIRQPNSTLSVDTEKVKAFQQRARESSSLGKPKTDPGTTDPGEGREKRSTRRARPISEASPAQRKKVRDMACIVTGLDRHEATIDPMHLCKRSDGGCDDPLCVVPGERFTVHRPFDDGEFSLLEHLRPSGNLRRYLPEILHALDHYDGDLISLLQRLTGERWRPESYPRTERVEGNGL